MKKNILGLLSIVLVCLYPCLFMYFKNVGEARIIDVLPIALLFLVVAGIAFLVYKAIFRNLPKAIIMTDVSMLLLCNFELFISVLKAMGIDKHRHTIMLPIVALVVLIIGFIVYKKDEELSKILSNMLCIVLAALIVINGVVAVPTIIKKMQPKEEKTQDMLVSLNTDSVNTKDAPNIYMMIFDEYAGKENLDAYYGFDNAEFYEYLESKNFNVSHNSYNKESIDTCTLIPNLLNLDYIVDDSMPQASREKYLNCYLYDVAEFLGYEINTSSYSKFLYEKRSNHRYHSKPEFEETVGYYTLRNSIFVMGYKLYQRKINSDYDKVGSEGEYVVEALEYYESLADISVNAEKPQFNLGYFKTPHHRFLFKEDGTPRADDDSRSWANHDLYLGYLKWTNHRIEKIVNHIIETDPNAIIIIQADHGARYVKHGVEQKFDVEGLDPKYQNNILNCVYYKGETFDIEGLSGINTVRKVLNEQFGTNLEMLEYTPEAE